MANLLDPKSGFSSSRQPSPGGPGGPNGLQERGGQNLLDPAVQQERGLGAYYKLPRWQSGGQLGSTANAFNTDFNDRWFAQQKESANKGENQYERKDYTGIVLRDAGTGGRKFGDVYDNGSRVGNVFDMYGADQANQMLLPMMAQSKTQAETFSRAVNDPTQLSREVEFWRGKANDQAKGFLSQKDYMDSVKEKQASQQEGAYDEALTAGGALSGALSGATIGALAGPVGIAAGAVVGGLAGGIGSWLNRDQLTSLTASTAVKMDQAREQRNTALEY